MGDENERPEDSVATVPEIRPTWKWYAIAFVVTILMLGISNPIVLVPPFCFAALLGFPMGIFQVVSKSIDGGFVLLAGWAIYFALLYRGIRSKSFALWVIFLLLLLVNFIGCQTMLHKPQKWG